MTNVALLLYALLAVIPVSVGIRVIICHILMVTDPEQEQVYKTRRNNALLFCIIAETIVTTMYAFYSYFV